MKRQVAPVREGAVSETEQRLGVPTFFWAAERGPDLRALGLTPVEAARRHLLGHGAMYRWDAAKLASTAIVDRVHDLGPAGGAVVVSFRREVEGVPVFRERLNVVMDSKLRLVALSGYLSAAARVDGSFLLTDETATGLAIEELGGGVPSRHPSVREVLYSMPDRLVPAYSIELRGRFGAKAPLLRGEGLVVSAVDGRILSRTNHVAAGSYTYRAWADPDGHPWDAPTGNGYTPHPSGIPDGTQPTLIPSQLITLQNGPISTNDPWLPAGATGLTGNNADAYADLAAPDGFGPGDQRAVPSGPNAFDYPYDFMIQPDANSTQISAALTQVFVTVNFLHDWFYDVGFDEAAGNAQQNNYGRGGLGGDRLLAEGLDSSGMDNADMYTPSDGDSPVMQMYVWTGIGKQTVTLDDGGGMPKTMQAQSATFGAQSFSLTGALVLADDGMTTTTDACEPLVNAAAVAGKIALVDRGTCTFEQKATNVQAAGAAGMVLANNGTGEPPIIYGQDPKITLPMLSVSLADGNALKAAIQGGTASVTLERASAVNRDGTVDGMTIAHEWGHYITNRLIGDGNGLNNLQAGGMGEGWGDFNALLTVTREEDVQVAGNATWGGVYPDDSYVTTGGSGNGLYFGTRRQPYTTDFAKNALTFKHIQDGVPLPVEPTSFGEDGADNSEVHNTGEVWGVTLWQCYTSLLSDTPRLTFAEAQLRMKRYMVAAWKATPLNPTILEARDAMLAAALAGDVEDFKRFRTAFAKRGMGPKAVGPERNAAGNIPVVEDFSDGNQLVFTGAKLEDTVVTCDESDGTLDNGETAKLTVTLKNVGLDALTDTTGLVTSATPGVTVANGGKVTFAPSMPFGTTTGSIEVSLSGAVGIVPIELAISFNDPALGIPAAAPVTVTFRGNVEEIAGASATDDVEAKSTAWTPGFDENLDTASPWKISEVSPTEHEWFGRNPDAPADTWLVSPLVHVNPSGDFVLSFKQRYDFEYDETGFYDGGVLELQVDGDTQWTDIGMLAVPGYDGKLDSPSSNPLKGRKAFAGQSPGYPEYETTTVNLGATYAGQAVRVRFRIGSDDYAAHVGWEVDDIAFSGIAETPFVATVGQTHVCGNTTPIATASAPQTAHERRPVTLTGSGSDADGDALTFQWAQVEGPEVTLAADGAKNATFTAPDVDANTVLGFELVANDGKEDSAPARVEVTVLNGNAAPVAMIRQNVVGQKMTLDGGGSFDPEGAALTYAWSQVAGPAVTLEGEGRRVEFVVPRLAEDERIEIQLVVNDGARDSQPVITVVAPSRTSGCGCTEGAGSRGALAWLGVIAAAVFARRRRPA